MLHRRLMIEVAGDGERLLVRVLDFDDIDPETLVGSVVRAKGTSAPLYDDDDPDELIGTQLFVQTIEQIEVIEEALEREEVPLLPISSILSGQKTLSPDSPIRAQGRVAHRDEASIFRSEEHTSELQSRGHLVCRLLLEKKKTRRSSALVSCRSVYYSTR